MVNDSKVFIRNIPFDCRESDLLNFFHGFGPIREIVLKNNYGFCTFQDYYDAREAVKETDGRRLLGVRVSVEMARGEFFRQEGAHSWHHNTTGVIKGDKATVFLGNLPPFCRELDIENFFNGYGSLRKIVIKRTFGFVEFEDLKDAEEAVKELTGRKLRGERITLEFAKHDKKTAAHTKKNYQNLASITMNNSVDVVTSILEDLFLDLATPRRGTDESFDSGSLADLNESVDTALLLSHPLPTSQDFCFYAGIALTVPPSPQPEDFSLSPSHLSPPSSLERSLSIPSSSSPLSGIPLLPLSGDAPPTQGEAIANLRRRHEVLSQLEEAGPNETAIPSSSSPTSKRRRLQASKASTNLLADLEGNSNRRINFPFTFATQRLTLCNDRADAYIPHLESSVSSASQTLSPPLQNTSEGSNLSRIDEEVSNVKNEKETYIIKTEYRDLAAEFSNEEKEDTVAQIADNTSEEITAETDLYVPSKKLLLNRAPRLGLSRLDRRGGGLHDLAIVIEE